MLNLATRLARQPGLLFVIVLIAAACSSPATSAERTAHPVPTPTVTASAALPATEGPVPSPTIQPTPEPSPTASLVPKRSPQGAAPTRTAPVTIAPPAPTSLPQATETPALTPSATPEMAQTDLQRLSEQAMTFLEELTAEFSPRQSGTEGELAAARFLESEFQSMGYEASLEPFTVELKLSSVELESPLPEVPSGFRTVPIKQSIEDSATGILISAGMGFTQDIPAGGLVGRVALIERGTVTFEEKVDRVAEAGAVGAVIFNNGEGMFQGTFKNRSRIPAVSISQEDGLVILELLERYEVSATITVGTRVYQSQNVVAEKPGAAVNEGSVVLGGHYDTVEGVLGANDNGSGSATVVTVARAIVDKTYPFDIRFVLFGSEELGLLGSVNHLRTLTSHQRDDIIAMFNFDALGTGAAIGVLGDRDLLDEAVAIGGEVGIPVRRRFHLGNASSDHASFQQAGIPVIFFLADDISRIHTPDDSLQFVQPELMGGAAIICIDLLDTLVAA